MVKNKKKRKKKKEIEIERVHAREDDAEHCSRSGECATYVNTQSGRGSDALLAVKWWSTHRGQRDLYVPWQQRVFVTCTHVELCVRAKAN